MVLYYLNSAVRFTGLAVVFHGWEMVACEAVSGKGR